MELRRARVLLADVVSSAVETARPAIDAAGHELTVSLPAGAGLPRRRPDPAGPGVQQPAHQQRQVHRARAGASGSPPSGAAARWSCRCGTPGSASRPRPCRASSTCSPRWTGRIERTHRRPGHRAGAGQGPGRDARRHGHGRERRARARAARSPSRCRRWRTARTPPAGAAGRRARPRPGRGGASWWWTTTGTRRTRWR